MFLLRKANFKHCFGKKIYLPKMRSKNLFQTKDKSCQNQGSITAVGILSKMNEQISEENARKIQELQMLEQNLQNFLIQKQAFQFEENEIINASEELKTSEGDVYKIVGQIMIKSQKNDLEKELKSKKELIQLRLKNIEKQEGLLREKATKLREELLKELKY